MSPPDRALASRRRVLQGLGGALAVSAVGCGETGPAVAGGPRDAASKGDEISPAGLSEQRLGRLHDAMAAHRERDPVPGLITLISRRGEVHVDVIGAKAAAGREPMTRDTIFRIASLTKPITAAAAMILVGEGKLRLDESVERLLPELTQRKVLKRLEGPLDDTVPAQRAITVRDLLTFRMGFGIIFDDPAKVPVLQALEALHLNQGTPGPAEPPAPDEWMRRFATLPLLHQPGEKWMYNTSSDLLGVLVARAAGRSFDAYLQERIFQPLGMKDTGFSVPASKLERLATSYLVDPSTGALSIYDEARGQWSRPPAFPSGAGGLVSTVDDYAAFGRMMLNKGTLGSVRILSKDSVEAMTTDQLTPQQKAVSGMTPDYFANHGWGFGMSVLTKDDPAVGAAGMYGWDGGLGTSWYAHPKDEMMTILFSQRSWTSPEPPPLFRDFWALAYRSLAG